jgi:transposase InsO family protein
VEVIPIVPGSKPPYRKQYRTTPAERAEVVKRVRELLDKNMIEPSKSPYSAPLLFVRKKDGSLRLVLDYRALNAITVKNRYPIPRIDDLLDGLKGAQVFSCLDLSGGYHQLQLQESDRPKTAFATHLGHYQWRVMPMGISNAPSVFQATMNHLFQHMIGKSVFIYLDDILIASRTAEEHESHLQEVLSILADNKLYVNRAKCSFNLPEVHYLGYIVGVGGVRPDPKKVQVVQDWPRPQTAHDVRAFLGLTQYFRRFIKDYSLLAAPLHALLQKKSKCEWNPACQVAFEKLKQALLTAPVLGMPDYDQPYELEVWTDASNIAVGAVLMQNGHPIAYESRKFSSAERNYNTTDREMLAIIHALRVWRCYLEGAQFKVKCDHKALSFFKTKADVTPRQARWLEFLERFNLSIDHVAGKVNVSDVLSRIEHGAEGPVLAVVTRRPKDKRKLTEPAASGTEWEDEIRAAVVADAWFRQPKNVKGLQHRDGLWFKGTRVVLPEALRDKCLQQAHDSPVGGHKGVTKTLELMQRTYWWPTVRKDVIQYVTTCASCQRNKARNVKSGGLLQPLQVPEGRWYSVSMDYITGLPCTAAGYDAVYVVLDRLTKMAHFVPCTKDVTAEGTADLFVREVVRLHGYPLEIISDRDSKFASKFWQRLFEQLGVQQRMSTAFHPQTDGGTERLNRILEEYLRAFINPEQNDWDRWLPLAEFAYNNSKQESVGYTPFFLNYGMHPRLPVAPVGTDVGGKSGAELAVQLGQHVVHAKSLLQAAQQRQKHFADKRRREVQFAVGDLVMLDTKHIKLRTPGAHKLMPKYIGPFKVLDTCGPVAYRLQLPDVMRRMHPVFHVSLLHKYREDGRRQPPPPPISFGEEDWFEIESILGERVITKGRRKVTQYLCAFKGYGPEDNEWCDENGVTELAVRAWRQSRATAN